MFKFLVPCEIWPLEALLLGGSGGQKLACAKLHKNAQNGVRMALGGCFVRRDVGLLSGVVVVRCVMGPHLLSPPPLVEWSGGIGKAGHVLVLSSLCNGMFGGVSSMGNAY